MLGYKKLLYSNLSKSFQAGVDTLYNKCKSCGSTPSNKTPTAISTAIQSIYTNRYNTGYNAGDSAGYTRGYNAGKGNISISSIIKIGNTNNLISYPTGYKCFVGLTGNGTDTELGKQYLIGEPLIAGSGGGVTWKIRLYGSNLSNANGKISSNNNLFGIK